MANERLPRQIEPLLDEADEAITKEDWSTVAGRARAILRIDPENSDALSYLSVAERDSDIAGAPPTIPVQPSQPMPDNDQPASFANCRYEVKHFLGEAARSKSTSPRTPYWTGK